MKGLKKKKKMILIKRNFVHISSENVSREIEMHHDVVAIYPARYRYNGYKGSHFHSRPNKERLYIYDAAIERFDPSIPGVVQRTLSLSGQRTKTARRERVEKDLRTSCIAQYNDDDGFENTFVESDAQA